MTRAAGRLARSIHLFANSAESPKGVPVPTYDIEVTRDGRWWMIHIPALDGLTQARFPTEIDDMARDYIAVTLDIPIADVRVNRSD
jgi:hypothetical protein